MGLEPAGTLWRHPLPLKGLQSKLPNLTISSLPESAQLPSTSASSAAPGTSLIAHNSSHGSYGTLQFDTVAPLTVVSRFRTASSPWSLDWKGGALLMGTSQGTVQLHSIDPNELSRAAETPGMPSAAKLELVEKYVVPRFKPLAEPASGSTATASSLPSPSPGKMLPSSRIHHVALHPSASKSTGNGLLPSPGTQFVALENNTLHLWDLASPGKPLASKASSSRTTKAPILSASWNPQKGSTELLIAGHAGDIKLLDTRALGRSGVVWKIPQAHDDIIRQVAWSPLVPHWIASAGDDSVVHVWDVRHRAVPVASLAGHANSVNALAWNPYNAELLASAGRDATVVLWNLNLPPHYRMHSSSSFKDSIVGLHWSDTPPRSSGNHAHRLSALSASGELTVFGLSPAFLEPLVPHKHLGRPMEHALEASVYQRDLGKAWSLASRSASALMEQQMYEEAADILSIVLPPPPPKGPPSTTAGSDRLAFVASQSPSRLAPPSSPSGALESLMAGSSFTPTRPRRSTSRSSLVPSTTPDFPMEVGSLPGPSSPRTASRARLSLRQSAASKLTDIPPTRTVTNPGPTVLTRSWGREASDWTHDVFLDSPPPMQDTALGSTEETPFDADLAYYSYHIPPSFPPALGTPVSEMDRHDVELKSVKVSLLLSVRRQEPAKVLHLSSKLIVFLESDYYAFEPVLLADAVAMALDYDFSRGLDMGMKILALASRRLGPTCPLDLLPLVKLLMGPTVYDGTLTSQSSTPLPSILDGLNLHQGADTGPDSAGDFKDFSEEFVSDSSSAIPSRPGSTVYDDAPIGAARTTPAPASAQFYGSDSDSDDTDDDSDDTPVDNSLDADGYPSQYHDPGSPKKPRYRGPVDRAAAVLDSKLRSLPFVIHQLTLYKEVLSRWWGHGDNSAALVLDLFPADSALTPPDWNPVPVFGDGRGGGLASPYSTPAGSRQDLSGMRRPTVIPTSPTGEGSQSMDFSTPAPSSSKPSMDPAVLPTGPSDGMEVVSQAVVLIYAKCLLQEHAYARFFQFASAWSKELAGLDLPHLIFQLVDTAALGSLELYLETPAEKAGVNATHDVDAFQSALEQAIAILADTTPLPLPLKSLVTPALKRLAAVAPEVYSSTKDDVITKRRLALVETLSTQVQRRRSSSSSARASPEKDDGASDKEDRVVASALATTLEALQRVHS